MDGKIFVKSASLWLLCDQCKLYICINLVIQEVEGFCEQAVNFQYDHHVVTISSSPVYRFFQLCSPYSIQPSYRDFSNNFAVRSHMALYGLYYKYIYYVC